MKKVVIEKLVETVIRPEDANEDQIIIGLFCMGNPISFDKLSKVWIDDILKYQWCDLGSSDQWNSCGNDEGFETIENAIKSYLESSDSRVYVFDTFEQFLEEFPALVKSKK